MVKTLAVLTLVAALVAPAPRAATLEVGDDLLALVAMPLAVAAVSEMTNVPASDLMDVVSLLNEANVSPVQFVEVVRYVPIALVAPQDSQPRFVEVVRQREQSGLRGTELVKFIEDQFQTTYQMPSSVDLDVTRPRVDVIDEDFVPAVVRTRVAAARMHPHGGPPGQLKKQLGVQTGAEVIHVSIGRHHAPQSAPQSVAIAVPDDRAKHEGKHENQGEGHGEGHGHGGGEGHGHGKGKGKG